MSNVTTWLEIGKDTIDEQHRRYLYVTHLYDMPHQVAFLAYAESKGYKMNMEISRNCRYAGFVLDYDKKDVCPIVAQDFPMMIFAASGCSHPANMSPTDALDIWLKIRMEEKPNVVVTPPSNGPRHFVAECLKPSHSEHIQAIAFRYGFAWAGHRRIEHADATVLFFDANSKQITYANEQFVQQIRQQIDPYSRENFPLHDVIIVDEKWAPQLALWIEKHGFRAEQQSFNDVEIEAQRREAEMIVEPEQCNKPEEKVMSNENIQPPQNPFAGMIDYITAEVVRKIGDTVSEDKVTKMVNDILAKQRNRVMITIDNKRTQQKVDINEPVHRAMVEVIGVLKSDCWVAVVGPSGGGKTLGGLQYAKACSIKHVGIKQMNQMLMPHDLIGFIDAAGKYQIGAWTNCIVGRSVETGSTTHPDINNPGDEHALVIIDEMDNANPNIIMLVKALATGHIAMPYGLQKINPNLQVMATMNTWGSGATREYVGRMAQDVALLNEFQFVEWDYDTDFEWELLNQTFEQYKDSQNEYQLEHMMRLHGMFISMRSKAETNKVRVIISTRNLISVAKMLLSNPTWSIHQTLKKSVYKGLKEEEWKRIEAPEQWKASHKPAVPGSGKPATVWQKPAPKADGSPF